jgi:hypothetical protein
MADDQLLARYVMANEVARDPRRGKRPPFHVSKKRMRQAPINFDAAWKRDKQAERRAEYLREVGRAEW